MGTAPPTPTQSLRFSLTQSTFTASAEHVWCGHAFPSALTRPQVLVAQPHAMQPQLFRPLLFPGALYPSAPPALTRHEVLVVQPRPKAARAVALLARAVLAVQAVGVQELVPEEPVAAARLWQGWGLVWRQRCESRAMAGSGSAETGARTASGGGPSVEGRSGGSRVQGRDLG